MKILLIGGARPNFMKVAPILRALNQKKKKDKVNRINVKVVHTGQHYDYEMSKIFLEELEIPENDYYLAAGSGSHAEQTAKVMVEFEKVCIKEKPDIVIVVGDVNSTLACSVTAKKMSIQVAHVEAGLRSGDMSMPEEINRIVTDSISDYLFVTEKSGVDNLLKEGRPKEKIHLVGNVMIDNLFYQFEKLSKSNCTSLAANEIKTKLDTYAFLTLHRPSNVDKRETFLEIAEALEKISEDIPIIFSVHPRTKKMIEAFGIELHRNIHLLEPLGFRESLFLWKDAIMVMTDSGGLQEETTALGVPCLTIRENTERPITVEMGTNIIAGTTKTGILKGYREIVRNGKKGAIPPLWDGKAAERIVDTLIQHERAAGGK